MVPKKREPVRKNNFLSVLAGIVVGSLVGAVTMILMAPRSGKETRDEIMEKGNQLRDRATELVEDTVSQVRSSADKLSISGREKAKELIQQGQAMVVEQLENVSQAALAGKKAVEAS